MKMIPRLLFPRAFAWAALVCSFSLVQAQQPAHYQHANVDLDRASELFDKAQYGAALFGYDRVVERIVDPYADARVEAEFRGAICSVRLFHDDASNRLLDFIDHHPENFHVPAIRLELFRYYFGRKHWEDALSYASAIDPLALGAREGTEFAFKKGYALFQTDQQDKAQIEFAKVKQEEGLYAAPATYYDAHINYAKRNYAAALEGFEKLKEDPNFGRIVPYYIAQIQFLQGHYQALLDYAKPLLADPEGARSIGDINRLAGEAYFRTGQYPEALPYLEKGLRQTGVQRGDRYMTGYAYYKTGDYKQAVDQFTQVINNSTDSLAQLSAYNMADCYLKLGQKNYARNAFKKAYELGNDQRITEDALFNQAKLAYELSFDPYNEAIIALRDYMKAYPDSPRHDEAQEFLLDVYLKTRNYEAALTALDAIKDKDMRLKEAYQKLAFDRGAELYEGRKYTDALIYFDKALKYPVDQQAVVRTHYWAGESEFALGHYDAALAKYDKVRNSSGAYATALYEQAGYSMGYAYFKQKNYTEAAISFRRALQSSDIDADQRRDAKLRIGDSYFVNKDMAVAMEWYDKAIADGTPARDYAQYQKAICLGLLKRNPEKIATLKQLLSDKPNSSYAADAKFQLGETYLQMEQDVDALAFFQQVVQQHPNSPHVREAMLKSALVQQRQGHVEAALAGFKAVVAKYPTVEGSAEALSGIENIYVEQGKVAEYESYVRSLDFVDPSTLDLDEKYYRSAEQLYIAGKCDEAVGAFGDYLAKYPKGAYALNANFHSADCLYRAKDYIAALPKFEQVIKAGDGSFLEPSLYAASDILYRDQRWEGALDDFVQLEKKAALPVNVLAAQVGQMRCLMQLQRSADAAVAAGNVLKNTEIDADLKAEAGLIVAQAALDANELDAAFTRFSGIAASSKNAYGAEAAYNMAYVRYLQKDFKQAEKLVFDLVKKFPSYDHWKAKGFILLGDVYVGMEDTFQAKTTLQSVIDHCDEPDLVSQAAARLANINGSEQAPDGDPKDGDIAPDPGRK